MPPTDRRRPDETRAAERIGELIAEIRRHDRLYYERAAPVISDAEYDALFRELAGLEAAHPALARPDSPTQRVGGAPVDALAAVPHRRPMLSLANTYDRQEVADWLDGVIDFLGGAPADLSFSCEPKLDGVALEVVYERGRFVRAVTRGLRSTKLASAICTVHAPAWPAKTG